jgi:hypothetical protein
MVICSKKKKSFERSRLECESPGVVQVNPALGLVLDGGFPYSLAFRSGSKK